MLADARERFGVDRRRQFVGGYSMGGIATYQLLSQYPDEFAGAVLWAGTKPTDTELWLPGARWVPVLFVHAAADEVVTYTSSLQSAQRLEALGYEVQLATTLGEHEYQAVTDDYRLAANWFRGRRAPVDPPRVTYVRYPAHDRPGLGLKADSAYWLSDIRAGGAAGTIDATTSALGGSLPGTAPIGPETVDGPLGPVVLTGQRYALPGTRLPIANELTVTMDGVERATVDAARAGLDPSAPLRVVADTEGPATLVLRSRCERMPTLSGDATLTGSQGELGLRFGRAGAHTVTLSACAAPLGLPAARHCVSRRRFTIRLPRGRLRAVRVTVNGKRVRARVVRRGRSRARIDLRGLPRGVVRVTITARRVNGRQVRQTRRYVTCSAGARGRR